MVARLLGVATAEITLDRRDDGKPVLAGPHAATGVAFSHTDDRLAVAVWPGGDVGVDIERVDRRLADPRRLARRVLHPHELATLDDLAELAFEGAVIRYWTRKEAVLKASGRGLRGSLAEIDAGDDVVIADGVAWNCRTVGLDDLVVSVAWPSVGSPADAQPTR